MLLPAFDPPGNLIDLDAAGRQAWSQHISDTIDEACSGNDGLTNDSPRAQFYNPTKVDTAADAQTQVVTWTAFPRQVQNNTTSDNQRWTQADASRDVQDEYCEWNVVRRPADNKITQVVCTCEGPEYWDTLATTNPDKVVALYQQFVNPAVQKADLFDSKKHYIPRNRWNTDTTNGIMHLVQNANNLGAEIDLAAAATITRVINGRELTGEQELINCGLYGVPARNSDPHIGGIVNGVARLKADITLANPIGLYFNDLGVDATWKTPDGSDPKSYWTYTRGDPALPVRAVYEVPAEKNFVVGDITINGKPITFGGQIIDFITMKLSAVGCRIGQSTVQPMTACAQPISANALHAAVSTVLPVVAHRLA